MITDNAVMKKQKKQLNPNIENIHDISPTYF